MKDITFRSLTSESRKIREFSISEIVENDGIQSRTDKHWVYRVNAQVRLPEGGNLRKWMRDRIGMNEAPRLKYLSILKSHDSKLHEDKFTCNAVGEFFVISGEYLFAIEFFYLLGIELAALTCKK